MSAVTVSSLPDIVLQSHPITFACKALSDCSDARMHLHACIAASALFASMLTMRVQQFSAQRGRPRFRPTIRSDE
jgi:hypothetical protein